MPAQRLPWFKVHHDAIDNEKLASLTDGQFRALVHCWARASVQPIRGRFASVRHAATITGRTPKEINALINAGLLEERDGALWVHDWSQWQERYPSDFNRPSRRQYDAGVPDRELELDDEEIDFGAVIPTIERSAEDSANTPPIAPPTVPAPLLVQKKEGRGETPEKQNPQRGRRGFTPTKRKEERRARSAQRADGSTTPLPPSTTPAALRARAQAAPETRVLSPAHEPSLFDDIDPPGADADGDSSSLSSGDTPETPGRGEPPAPQAAINTQSANGSATRKRGKASAKGAATGAVTDVIPARNSEVVAPVVEDPTPRLKLTQHEKLVSAFEERGTPVPAYLDGYLRDARAAVEAMGAV